ncbi:MAG: hypothetical protein R3362_08780, partial [Rhodothermales bacterium]|nr:hypothetical protein [Rhodothermales bacterium]
MLNRYRNAFLVACCLFLGAPPVAHAQVCASQVALNEIRVDETATGDPNEYIELCGPSSTDLSSYSIVVLGDQSAGTNSGYVEDVISLSGQSMPGDGIFLIAQSGFTGGA